MSSSVTLRAAFALLLSTLALSFGLTGCGKSDSPDSAAAPSTLNSQPSTPVLKLHWLGRDRLATEANATNFMAIWNLPESAALQNQTLAKLATAPWRLWQTNVANVAVSNAPTAQLRPLLDDLVHREIYLEVVGDTNASWQAVLALRLPADRAALWQSNLPMILRSLYPDFGSDSTPNSYLLTSNSSLAIIRSNDWTLISFSAPTQPSTLNSQPDSTLLTTFLSRLATHGAPYAPRATNYWVELEFAPQPSGQSSSLGLVENFPAIHFFQTGDGLNVRSHASLTFSQSVFNNLSAWQIPTDLVMEPLTGLTVLRDWKPLLLRLGIASSNLTVVAPHQFLHWSRSGAPLQLYFAGPTDGTSNQFERFALPVMEWINSHSDAARFGRVQWNSENRTMQWQGLSLCVPFVQMVTNASGPSVYGGFGLTPAKASPLPLELRARALTDTNLLYFSWEHTPDTLPQWRYLDDVSRMIFDNAHASRLRNSREAIEWIQTNLTNLSHAITEAQVLSPHQLQLTRRSTLGLTAFELNLAINWISMVDFPGGFSSFWRTNPAPFARVRAADSGATQD